MLTPSETTAEQTKLALTDPASAAFAPIRSIILEGES